MTTQITTRDLGKPIAIGGTAEIYDREPGWVLKLYFDRFEPGMADYERRITNAICATGLPISAVGEIVNMEGRKGLLYQKCTDEPMGEDLAGRPWRTISYAFTLAELHAKMHNRPVRAEIPPQAGKQNLGCKTSAEKLTIRRAQSARKDARW